MQIVIVGAADTGRAPLTAAMLRRLLAAPHPQVAVSSGGVLADDGDAPSTEAMATAEQLGLDLSHYVAHTYAGEPADLLIAIDSGVARVVRLRFPDRAGALVTLGELAGTSRDIPDPFKMQIGAWLLYAAEIERALVRAVPQIVRRLGLAPDAAPDATSLADASPASPNATSLAAAAAASSVASPASPAAAPAPDVVPEPTVAPERAAAVERMLQLLAFVQAMPQVVDWGAARAQLERDAELAAAAAGPSDLAPALLGVLRAALALTAAPPRPGQVAAIAAAVAAMAAPVGTAPLAALSGALGGWPEL